MEFLIGAIVIIVLLLILGVDPMMILLGGIWIVEIFFILMTIFFVISLILLCLTKKTKGEFLRIDPNEGEIGTHAVYQIQGEEYNNSFPAEIMFTDKIYHTGKTVTLRQRDGKKLKLLFDNYSMIVIGTGLPVFTALAIALGFFLKEIAPYLKN
ncbi:MAG: hypothetical protein K2J71_07725 [Oscillospiraceae bacterium]|nr:hypothetical protein [Oscillospiraceae bacterium]